MSEKTVDLNLSNPALAAKAAELGWSKSVTARVVDVGKAKAGAVKGDEIVVAEAENGELLRRAAGNPSVSLINPSRVRDFYKDEGLIRAVAGEGKAFEIPLAPLLGTEFVFRAKLITQTREFVRRCLKLHAPLAFTSRAQSAFDLKSPRETIALIPLLGLTEQQARYAITKGAQKIAGAEK